MGAAYASHGVTGYLPTLAASYPEEVRPVFDFLASYLEEGPVGAKVLGVHMEGPFFHPEKRARSGRPAASILLGDFSAQRRSPWRAGQADGHGAGAARRAADGRAPVG